MLSKAENSVEEIIAQIEYDYRNGMPLLVAIQKHKPKQTIVERNDV